MDFMAIDSAELIGLSYPSITFFFGRLHRKSAQKSEQQAPVAGIIEVDDTCFGTGRILGKYSREALDKTIAMNIV